MQWPHSADYSLIWRITPDEETRRLIDAQPNVHAFPWVDQVTILADPRTKAFISHCGNNGRLEAAFNGVPGIFMPLCNDQYYCTSIAIHRGIGVYLDLTPEMHKNLKEKLLNHPVDLAEMFVKHVEYAATFESNEEMHLASIDMSFAVYHNLDIYSSCSFFLVYKLIRAVQRVLSRLLFPKPKRE
ncbi:putative UDP-glucuronosyltransferase ugt-48 [Aphelenchoides fujianensis]|nr:putative UDP-glucuronosyltransferase ugt-48 [Aphelenchoides fujianensis]